MQRCVVRSHCRSTETFDWFGRQKWRWKWNWASLRMLVIYYYSYSYCYSLKASLSGAVSCLLSCCLMSVPSHQWRVWTRRAEMKTKETTQRIAHNFEIFIWIFFRAHNVAPHHNKCHFIDGIITIVHHSYHKIFNGTSTYILIFWKWPFCIWIF